MASMTTNEFPPQERTSPITLSKERLLPAFLEDLSGYTPQRHLKKWQGRVIQSRSVQSSKVEAWRAEVGKDASATRDAFAAKPSEQADEDSAPALPSECGVLGNGEKEQTVTVLPVLHTGVDGRATTTIAFKSSVKAVKVTPRQPLKQVPQNGRGSIPSSTPRVRRRRDVAGTAATWRSRPDQESTTIVPPPPTPVLPKTQPRTPAAKTYKTKVRSTLPEQSPDSGVADHDVRQNEGGENAENKRSRSGYDQEPVTSSFRFPEDASPFAVSQERRSLEEYLRDRQRATPDLAKSHLEAPTEAKSSQPTEQLDDEVDQDENETAFEEQGEDEEEVQSRNFQEEALSELEIELLNMADGHERRYPASMSSGPKRQRKEDPEYSVGDEDILGDENTLEIPKMSVKKRRTERRVPNAEIRKAALRELSDKSVRKGSRQTSDFRHSVVEKLKRSKKSKKSKQHEKRIKEPRRIPDHGQLMIGPDRLKESDIQIAPSPPLELSQDPISHISESEDEDDMRRAAKGPMAMMRTAKDFGKADMSLFRIPKRPHARSRSAQITTYSDGFSDKEREPIGRMMSVKQVSRRKESYNPMTIRYGELSLVKERPPDEERENTLRRKKLGVKKKASKTVFEQDDAQTLVAEAEDFAIVATVDQSKETMEAGAQPHTPIFTDQSLLSSTPTGNISPTKRKSQNMRLNPRANHPTEPRTMTQQIVAGKPDEQPTRPSSTVPLFIKSKTEKQKRKDQIASQEISLVVMKRPSEHGGKEEQELGDQEMTGLGDDDLATRSGEVPEEDDAYKTASENESEGGLERISYETDLYLGSENLSGQEDCRDSEENLNYVASIPSNIMADEHDMETPEEASSGMHLRLCGTARVEIHQQEISNLVAELKEQTKSEKARIRGKLQAPPTSLRASSRCLPHTPIQRLRSSQYLPPLASIAAEALKIEQLSIQHPRRSTNEHDGIWRPRVPDTSGPDMQVDEEIFDSPTPPYESGRAALSRRQSLRRQSSIRSQSLRIVDQLPETGLFEIPSTITYDSQEGSIILGDTQNFRKSYPADIPETQVEDDDVKEMQVVIVPCGSYFSQSSRQLSQPIRASSFNRKSSSPTRTGTHVHIDLRKRDGNDLMAGGISMSAAFQHTLSAAKSSPGRQHSQQTPSQPRTLRELTRSASKGLGTLHGSAKRRTASLVFNPPLKKPSHVLQA